MTRMINAAFLCAGLLLFLPGAGELAAMAARERPEAEKAPAFTLPALDGQPVTLAEALEKSEVILVFWASWCPPCVRSVPDMRRFHEFETRRERETREKRVRLLGINLREEKETVEAFVGQHRLAWPVLLDARAEVARAYEVRGVPTVVLIGRDGRIRHTGHSFRQLADTFYPEAFRE